MTESEKIDYLHGGKSADVTKCIFCDRNLDIRCSAGQYDLFNKISQNDDCPDFELRDDEIEEDFISQPHKEQTCPLCGNEAIWDDFAKSFICTNDECQHSFN